MEENKSLKSDLASAVDKSMLLEAAVADLKTQLTAAHKDDTSVADLKTQLTAAHTDQKALEQIIRGEKDYVVK